MSVGWVHEYVQILLHFQKETVSIQKFRQLGDILWLVIIIEIGVTNDSLLLTKHMGVLSEMLYGVLTWLITKQEASILVCCLIRECVSVDDF